ncbi:hypothetical protein NECAME_16983, partial [Necator americanus]
PQKRAPALHDTAFTTAIFFTLLQLVLVSPDFVSDDVARIFSTLLAGITIYVNSNSLCLANPVIVYCGDISYVLYLIHWPVIVAARYYTDTQQLSIGGEDPFVIGSQPKTNNNDSNLSIFIRR